MYGEHGVKVQLQKVNWASLQARLQNSMLAGTETPDLAELFEGSMGYFTRGPVEDFGVMGKGFALMGEDTCKK